MKTQKIIGSILLYLSYGALFLFVLFILVFMGFGDTHLSEDAMRQVRGGTAFWAVIFIVLHFTGRYLRKKGMAGEPAPTLVQQKKQAMLRMLGFTWFGCTMAFCFGVYSWLAGFEMQWFHYLGLAAVGFLSVAVGKMWWDVRKEKVEEE